VRRAIPIAVVAAILVLPTVAHAYSIHGYRVRDDGSTIRHSLTICKDRYDRVHRFELATRVEMADGTDKRFRYSTHSVRWGCLRLTQWYPDVLKYRGWYYGRVKVRLLQTDDVQYTPWRRFRSS
jgi:hypothetical protein